MEKLRYFRDRQEARAEDVMDIETFAQESSDHIVADGITNKRRYVDFVVTKETGTSIRVGTGRLYDGGKRYVAEQETVIPMSVSQVGGMPVLNKKIVSVYVYKNEIDTEIQERDFEIDADNQIVEPQPVPMLKLRKAEVQVKGGQESVVPEAPSLPDGAVEIAQILLTTEGIPDSGGITRVEANVLPSVEENAAEIVSLNAFKNEIKPKVSALSTEMAALKVLTEGKAGVAALIGMMGDLAVLKERAQLPSSYAQYHSDLFVNLDHTDTALTGTGDAATAIVDDRQGLTFPYAAKATPTLALFNQYDEKVYKTATDFVLPAFDSEKVVEVTGDAGEISISQYAVQLTQTVAYTVYEQIWHAGETITVGGGAADWGGFSNGFEWGAAHIAPYAEGLANGTVTQAEYDAAWWEGYSYSGGETNPTTFTYPGYYESVPVIKYKTETTQVGYNGSVVAQTFVAPRGMWLTKLDLFFTKKGAVGDVKVFIVDTTDSGTPDPKRVLTQVNLPVADIKTGGLPTPVTLPPAWLEAGRRLSVLLVTEGSHFVAFGNSGATTNGTFFYGTDGAFFQGDPTKDLRFALYAAAFKSPRTEVNLQGVSLAGGMADLRIATQAITPEGTRLAFEVYHNSTWHPLSEPGVFSTLPEIVNLRAVFFGTRDAQPGFQLGSGKVLAFRSADALVHFSDEITLDAAKTNFRVDIQVTDWDAVKNTLDVKILTGGTFATVNSPSATVIEDIPGKRGKIIKKTFALGGAVSSYKIKTIGGRAASTDPLFTIRKRVDIAIS